jgi:4-amino-4-deoxy-L-arabinose transferase-like glycosyltransferase
MRPASLWVILVAGILLGSMTVSYSWTGSTSIFSYVALRILEGGAAYLHGWDIKGPGVYYFFALAHGLFGPTPMAFRVLEVAWETATALTVAGIAMHIYGRQAAAVFAGLAYLLLYFSQNFWNFAISDGLLNLPLALSFLLLLRAMQRGSGWQWGAAGFLVGVAALFKLPFGLAGVPMLWAAWRCSPQGGKAVLRRWGWLAAGLAACFVPVALYFLWKEAFGAFYSAYVLAAFSHTDRHREFLALPCFLENANKPVRYPLYAIALLGLVGAFAGKRDKPEGQRRAEILLLAWLGVAVVVFLMHGAYADYHFLPALAPVVVLAGGALARWVQGAGWPVRKLAMVAAMGLLFVIPAEKFRQHLKFTYGTLAGPRPPPFMHKLSGKLRENTTAEDRIFVWGEIAEIYLDAGRRSPSRFATTYHLGTPMRYVNYRETFLGEFRANLPKYFVLIKTEKPQHPCAESLVDMDQAYYDFAELRAVVESNFQVVEDTAEYVLFLRN